MKHEFSVGTVVEVLPERIKSLERKANFSDLTGPWVITRLHNDESGPFYSLRHCATRISEWVETYEVVLARTKTLEELL